MERYRLSGKYFYNSNSHSFSMDGEIGIEDDFFRGEIQDNISRMKVEGHWHDLNGLVRLAFLKYTMPSNQYSDIRFELTKSSDSKVEGFYQGQWGRLNQQIITDRQKTDFFQRLQDTKFSPTGRAQVTLTKI